MIEKKYSNYKELQDGSKIYIKSFSIDDMSIKEISEGVFVGKGYANTKNKPDAYGDIPTNYKGKDVYDLKRISKNPIMLIDHENSAGSIAGKFTKLKEDKFGLYFEAQFMTLSEIYNPLVKHAVSAFINGYGKGLSIGGRWFFEDSKNPTHLTTAKIHEISLVGVGADEDALFTDGNDGKDIKGSKRSDREELEHVLNQYMTDADKKHLPRIQELTNKIKGIKKWIN